MLLTGYQSYGHQGAGKSLVFVDEKKFTVDAKVNYRNSNVIAYDPSDVQPVFQTKNSTSLMVFGTVASDGSVVNSHFITAGLKIITKKYLLPWMDHNFRLDNVVLIQDSVPNHTSKATQGFLGDEKVLFFCEGRHLAK